MTKSLNDYVKDNSKFLRLEEGETFEGVYVTFKVVPSKYDPEKETVIYKLRYPDDKETYFQTASVAVAKTLGKFKGGEKIKIKREGSGTNTKYFITSADIQIAAHELEPDQDIQF